MWFDQMTVVNGTRRALPAVVVVVVAFCLAGLLATAAWPRMHHPARGHRILPGGQAPLDGFTTPTGAYGFRKLRTAYAGFAVKLQRVDTTTQDIGFVGNDFDVASAATFCTTACTVQTWYDQSGNGRNLVQATAANQPVYVTSCTGGKPCFEMTAGTQALAGPSVTPATGIASFSVVADRVTVAVGQCYLIAENGAASNRVNTSTSNANNWNLTSPGGGGLVVAAPSGAWHALQAVIANGAASVMNVDGAETTGSATGNVTAGAISVIGAAGVTCRESEAIFWDNYQLTAGERAALNGNQQNYWMPGPLDNFTQPAGAYSFRRLRSAYAGPAVKLQRASDSAVQDINFLGCTGFTGCPWDVAAATSFCASTTCSVNTWYDQSGNARHLALGGFTTLPALVFDCPGLSASQPCARVTTVTTQGLQYPTGFAPTTAVTSLSVVGNRRSAPTAFCNFWRVNGVNDRLTSAGSANTWTMTGGGGGTISATAADAAWHAVQGVINGASSGLSVDGATVTGTVTGNTVSGVPQFLLTGVASSCDQVEMVTWDNYALSAGDIAVLTANPAQLLGVLMRRLALAAVALLLLRADMYPDASNAVLPAAAAKLGGSSVNVQAYGAVADAVRMQCAVTSTAAATAVTLAAPCAFAAADVGKPIVVWNAGTTATAPLATTIAAVTDATHLTLTAAPGQSLAASTQYVSWGTDNSTAIANAYSQAAKQLDPAGQRGYVYFPPGIAQVGGAKVTRYYGTTAAVGLAPNGYRIATQGAGPYNSQVLALAPLDATTGLAFESAGYDDGNVIRDIGFDGNMIVANVAYLACSPNGRLDNVLFRTPAAGGIGLKVGQSGSGNCPAMVATAVRVDSALNINAAQYPAKHVEINSTDTGWHNLLTSGPASIYAIHIASTAANTAMLSPHTSSTVPVNFQVDATVTYLDDPQVDNGNVGTTTGIVVNAASVKIVGGRLNLPTAATVGISVAANKVGIFVAGFDCNRFTTSANCIQVAYPAGGNQQIFANGSSTIVPALTQLTNQFPAATGSTAGVMMGLAGTITPLTSGTVEFASQGQMANSATPNGATVALRYGTGAAPANGVACTGTGPASNSTFTAAINGQKVPFAQKGYAGSLALGTPVWYDLCLLAVTGGTATITNVDIKAAEVSRY